MGIEHAVAQEIEAPVINGAINSNTPNTEKKHYCTAIIWLKNNSNNTAKDAIAATLQAMEGVSKVKYVREKPCIMMVDYCRDDVKSLNIVSAVNIHGGVARIIGC